MGEAAADRYMTLLTAIIYYALVACWLAIIIFYARQYLRFRHIYPIITTLLIVLLIDGARTLIESIYFGARYSARIGLLPAHLHTLLDQPYFVAIPKGINLIAALVIIMVIVRRWFAGLEAQERQRRAAEQFRSELIALASHELRTPLTSIGGYASTLLREFENLGEETKKEFLEGISSEAERLNRLVSDFLDMSQIEEGRLRIAPHALAPGQVCRRAIESISHPDLQHELRAEVAPDLPEVFADPDRVHQALYNLISNAVKFSPRGTEVVVGARERNGAVEFYVTDRGVGIPREEQAKLFTRFHRAENAHAPDTPGAGLGLYLAKAIVDSHNGEVGFNSELGRGSTFWFTLPTVEARRQAEDRAPRPRGD